MYILSTRLCKDAYITEFSDFFFPLELLILTLIIQIPHTTPFYEHLQTHNADIGEFKRAGA